MTSQPLSRRGSVHRGRTDLAVFEGGDPDGPTLVMVHGWPDTHRMWHGVADLLADTHRLVAYDTRGQGESVSTQPDDGFTLDVLGSDLLAVVDSVSPDRPVHLLAHDWGSVQAWEAVCRPGAEQRIASFTSMSGPHLGHVTEWVRGTLSRPSARGVGEVLGQALSSSYVPFLVSPLAPPVLRAVGGPRGWRRLLGAVEGRPPAPEAYADSLADDMVSGLRYYRANLLRRHDRRSGLRTKVPVLQLALTRDPAIRPAALAASDPWTESLERRALPLGHWAPVTHPAVVADQVAGFVREHPVA
ncbi:alpha/beta fold hydrolase [Nocardioides renjunii]|uniref:alpha/beta fold hydrolase n=1 Tax=Nocardioides renjunii TaxID=3095075 RepID=UPI002AFF4023|nr:alpha/beta fold hydrolase [Nocardioides sp. S-34]WQQ20765.1 alpha/beta fold hydrolase [Nocardioides sp. S-34]